MVQKRMIGLWATALLLGTLAIPAFGQPTPAQPGGGRAGFQQRMNDQLKQQLGVTDEEFTALQPKIEAVMTAQRATRGSGMFGGRRGGGGSNGTPGTTGTTPTDPNAPAPSPTQAPSRPPSTTRTPSPRKSRPNSPFSAKHAPRPRKCWSKPRLNCRAF